MTEQTTVKGTAKNRVEKLIDSSSTKKKNGTASKPKKKTVSSKKAPKCARS